MSAPEVFHVADPEVHGKALCGETWDALKVLIPREVVTCGPCAQILRMLRTGRPSEGVDRR